MRISCTTHRIARSLAATLISAAGFAGLSAATASAQSLSGDTYDWSANLISFDAETGTAVLQARIESYVEIAGLDEFEEGERLTLVWTGRNWAAGVRDLLRDKAADEQVLALPVEFVATARDDQYVNFRVPVPADSVGAIAEMEPGTRVTGISPRDMADWGEAIRVIRHYNDVS